jgi:hypothetical protein
MTMANYTGLIIIGAVLVVLLLFSGPLIAFATGIFTQFNQAISGLINQFGGGAGGSGQNMTGEAWFAFTVHFSDGTSQDINMNPTYSIFPLSITFENKTVTALDTFIRLNLVGSKMGSWSTTSSQHIEVYLNPNTTPATSSTASYTDSGSAWTSGETKTIQTTTIQSSTLDSLFAQYGTGTWLFQTTGSVALAISVNGVNEQFTATLNAGGVQLSNVPVNGAYSIQSIHNFQTFPLTPRK